MIARFSLICLCLAQFSAAVDWPHWRGPDRNGISPESTGWDDGIRLPDRELWRIQLGNGASSPLIVDGTLYTLGWSNNRDTLFALDAATGEVKWTQSYAAPKYGRFARGDQGYFSGVTGTPEFDAATGFLYSLSCDGDLQCWDTKKEGAKVWGLNFYDIYKIPIRPQVTSRRGSHRDYGYTSAPLVHGNLVLAEVGSPEHGTVIAYDKNTGKQVWASEHREHAGHSGGLAPMTIDGVACAAVLTARQLLVLRLDNGKTVAEIDWTTDFINNIATPAVAGSRVIISSRYNQDAMAMYEISLNGGAREVWKVKDATGVCSPIIHEGHVYWSGKGLHCLELETGRKKWEGSKFGDAGSCILTADDRLIIWSDSGSLTFAETAKRSPDKFTQLLRKDRVFNGKAWPHVVFADGRIYCRVMEGDMKCFSLRKEEQDAAPVVVSPPPAPGSKPVERPANLDLTNWPGEGDDSLIYGWKRGMANAAPLGKMGKSRVRLTARGQAKFDETGRMLVDGGSFHVQGASNALLAAAQQTGQLTIETILTTSNPQQGGPARILTFSTDGYNRNFTLAQERQQLLLRLRTPRTGENGMRPQTTLGNVEIGKPMHILITYRDGELVAYFNGERVQRSNSVTGDFSNWDAAQQLVFGAEFEDGRDWQGAFDGIAILNRFVGAEEASARFKAALGGAAPPKTKPQASAPPAPASPDRQAVELPFSAELSAGSMDRLNAIAELSIDLKTDSKLLNVTNEAGERLRNQWMPRTGTLFVEIPGEFAANSKQTIHISPGTPSLKLEPDVVLTEAGVHEGSDAWRIPNEVGNWFFAKQGGGFGSLEDKTGADWIGFRPTGGSAGNYRGLPNLVHPQGIFHAGAGQTKCETTPLAGGPLAVSLLSQTADGKWATRWDIFKRHARCTVLKADGPYWFLYEGTPGGKLDLDGNDIVFRDGQQSSATDRWQGRSHEWVAFGDRKASRSLLLVHQTADEHEDSYWPMQGNMTVFGFGRSGLNKFMTDAPNVFWVSLEDTVDGGQLAEIAQQLREPVGVVIR